MEKEKKAKTTGIGDNDDVVGDATSPGGRNKAEDRDETRGEELKDK